MKLIIKKNLLKITGLIFLSLLANCGNEKIKNNSSLNNVNLDLSEENFNKLYLIIENIDKNYLIIENIDKNCGSNELAQFFNEINIAFVTTNFSIEITKILNEEQYNKFQIEFVEPDNCTIRAVERFL